MEKLTLVVLSNPVEGRDDEYNAWYTNQHLGDVLQVPGFVGAQRFVMAAGAPGDAQWRYCAFYDVEHEDPNAAVAELLRRAGTDEMPMSGAMAGFFFALYRPITDRVTETVGLQAAE